MATGYSDTMMAKRNDVPVKIDAGVLAKVRIAAAYKGMSLAEYISQALEPIAEHDIEEGHSRLDRGAQPAKPKRPK